MYEGDSLFTLSPAGQAGLIAVTLVLSLLYLLAVGWLARGRAVWARVVIAVLGIWLFRWLSPQLYYLYYIAIFDGLPWQVVVKAPPGPGDMLRLLGFSGRATLSDHGQAALGWLGLAAALAGDRVLRWQCRNAAN